MVADSARPGGANYSTIPEGVQGALDEVLQACAQTEKVRSDIVRLASMLTDVQLDGLESIADTTRDAGLIRDGFFAGMKHASRVVAGTSTPPSSPGVALALANFRAALVRDLERRATRREVSL